MQSRNRAATFWFSSATARARGTGSTASPAGRMGTWLKRATHTLRIILDELEQEDLPIVTDAALNERDYGDLMGIDKDEARKRWGDEQVHLWQRSYDIAPPGGESLKDTAMRVVPFFERRIAPELRAGKSVIVVAHGNSLRTLIMQLDCLTPED